MAFPQDLRMRSVVMPHPHGKSKTGQSQDTERGIALKFFDRDWEDMTLMLNTQYRLIESCGCAAITTQCDLVPSWKPCSLRHARFACGSRPAMTGPRRFELLASTMPMWRNGAVFLGNSNLKICFHHFPRPFQG